MPGTASIKQPEFSKDEILALSQRVLESKTFAHSASLRQALEFIVRNGLANPSEPIKEFNIATEVFGRRGDFDPKADNIVRVQMHRLREKLDDFYLKGGREERIRIVIPRGQYNPEYVRNTADAERTPAEAAPAHGTSAVKRTRLDARWMVIAALVLCNLILVASLLRRQSQAAQPLARFPSSLSPVWQPFLAAGNEPLIVFANPAFLADERGNLYRYDSPGIVSMPTGTRVQSLNDQNRPASGRTSTGPYYYFDSYTGSGELVGAAKIARFLTAHGGPFLVERSRIASYEEIKSHNVIFLGGVKEDRILRQLPLAQELEFRPPPPGQYPMGSYIQDMNPPTGRPASYHFQLDPATGAIEVEYALISLLPNVSKGHYLLDLGGLTTLGTEAAADFVTSERDMAQIENMRKARSGGPPRSRFFQALLEVRVRDGVPLDARCLLVRELNQLDAW
jgi:hypothetical protein